jgi:hypothetical protein
MWPALGSGRLQATASSGSFNIVRISSFENEKSMARKTPVAKIAKALKRTPGTTAAQGAFARVSLDTSG